LWLAGRQELNLDPS